MDDEKSVESILKEQRDEFRHLRTLSQRFIQVLLALLAIGFVFAQKEWIQFFQSSSIPQSDFGITCPSGASVGGLAPTAAMLNGLILQALVIVSLGVIALAGIWAARVLFVDSPIYLPALGRSQVRANAQNIQKARTLFRRAYYILGLGLTFLAFAAIGYILFYFEGGQYILWFDILVYVTTIILLVYFLYRVHSMGLKNFYYELADTSVLLLIFIIAIIVFYVQHIVLNALNTLGVWMNLWLNFCPNGFFVPF